MWTFGLESSHEGPSLLPGQGGYLGELSQAGLWPQKTEGERLYQNLRPFPPSSLPASRGVAKLPGGQPQALNSHRLCKLRPEPLASSESRSDGICLSGREDHRRTQEEGALRVHL